jgi:hypothetical protein
MLSDKNLFIFWVIITIGNIMFFYKVFKLNNKKLLSFEVIFHLLGVIASIFLLLQSESIHNYIKKKDSD